MFPHDPFNICLRCTPAHIDNCPDCFGFGHYDGDAKVPVSAGVAQDLITKAGRKVVPCTTCHSTFLGVTFSFNTSQCSVSPTTA